jgi:hypothetical protein
MMKATYEHDCENCTLLGVVEIEGVIYDLYHCSSRDGDPTLISRWSSDGPDYSSGACFGERALVNLVTGKEPVNKPLMVAFTLALANGLDVEERVFGNRVPLTLADKVRQQSNVALNEKVKSIFD